MTKRPAADSELIIVLFDQFSLLNHHDLPKIKSIDILKQFKHITMFKR